MIFVDVTEMLRHISEVNSFQSITRPDASRIGAVLFYMGSIRTNSCS